MHEQPIDQSPQPPQPQQSPQSKRKRRRRWPWVILVLLALVAVLVILAPTIASTGMIRSLVVGVVNNQLNGRVEIADWSLGWSSPIRLSGIKVYDEQKRLILDVPRVQTGLSLLGAITSNFSLGGDNVIDIDSFVVSLDASGHSNLEKLVKSSPPSRSVSESKSSQPTKLPNISGKFTVNFRGRIEGSALPAPVHVEPSSVIVTIADINKPIETAVKLVYRVGDGQASTIQTTGTVGAIEDNQPRPEKLVASQQIALSNVNLAAAEAFLKSLGPDTKLAGIANGQLEVKAQGLTGVSASGEIIVQDLLFAGGPLKGDQFQTPKLSIPVSITRTVVDPTTTLIRIEKLGVQMPQASLAVSGQITEQAILNLAERKAPGAQGSISFTTDITDLANLASQLRNTLQLQQGVAITGGAVHHELVLAIEPDHVSLSDKLSAVVEGRRDGKAVKLGPITFDAATTAVPTNRPLPDLRDISLVVESPFATIQGGGASLAKLQITGNFDLGKLRGEIGQFADLGKLQMQGSGEFVLASDGDMTNPDSPILVSARANLLDVRITGLVAEQLQQDRLEIVASGKIIRKGNVPTGIEQAAISVVSGQAASPLLDLEASANLDLTDKIKAPAFELKRLNISSLAKLQEQYGSLMPTLAQQQIRIESGALYAKAEGSFDGTTLKLARPASLSLPTLTLSKAGKRLLSRETIRASIIGNFSLTDQSVGDTSVKVDSSLVDVVVSNVKASLVAGTWDMIQSCNVEASIPDIPKVQSLLNTVSSAETSPPSDDLKVTSGAVSLRMSVVRDAATSTTTLNLTDCQVSKLALKRGDREYRFDEKNPITLKLAAAVQAASPIQSIRISELAGDLRIASLELTRPIVITDPMGKESNFQGGLKLEGSIDAINPLLTVLQNSEPLPYSGKYQLAQQISTQGPLITLEGSIDITDFKVLDARKQAVFTEDRIAIRNNVELDMAQRSAIARTLTVQMPKSEALGVSLVGGVDDWQTNRAIRPGTRLDLNYDLQKIWTIVYPVLSPEQRESLKDVKLAGKFQRSFAVSGAYPDKPKWNESLKSLRVEGSLAVQMLQAMGLHVESLELPVTLSKGVLTIADAQGKPPKPAAANGGSLDLGGITLDLTGPDPLLSVPPKKNILYKVGLNPVLAGSLGKMGAVIFSNATEAEGQLTLNVVECQRLPLGSLIQKKRDARAQIVLTIEKLHLNGVVPQVISAAADLGTGGINGSVPPSTITIANGLADSDIAIMIDRQVRDSRTGRDVVRGFPLKLTGGLNLTSLELRDFKVRIPPELLLRDLRKFFPNGAEIPLRGSASKPQLDLQKAIIDNAGNAIIGGGGEGVDPLGGLLKQLGGEKDQKQSRPRQRGN